MNALSSGIWSAICTALLVGCGDTLVVPTPQGEPQPLDATITLTPDSSLRWVPDAVTIRVQVSGPDADSLSKLPVWWSSTDPNLVALAELTDTSVLAIPQHDGIAQVIATVGDVADTVRIVGREEGAVLAMTLARDENFFASPAFAPDGTIIVFGVESYPANVLAFDSGFAPLWTSSVEVEYRNAAIGESGTVFVSSGAGMAALSSAGVLMWEDATVHNGDAAPAIDGRGNVWFGGYADFGLTLAHYDASGLVAATPLPPGTNPIHLPPVIVGDSVVIVGGDHRLVGISLSDSILWQDTLPGPEQRLGYFPASAAGDGRTVYVPTAHNGPVFAIDGLTGAVKWSWQDTRPWGTWYALAPIVDGDGTIYVQTTQTLVALTADGAVRWQADSLYGNQFVYAGGAPALAGDGILYVACQWDLCAVNTADGSVRWRRPLPGNGIAGAIFILPDSSLVFQTVTEVAYGSEPSYLIKLRGRFPLADAPWPVDGGDLRRTRRGHIP